MENQKESLIQIEWHACTYETSSSADHYHDYVLHGYKVNKLIHAVLSMHDNHVIIISQAINYMTQQHIIIFL